MPVLLYLAGTITKTPIEISLIIRLRMGKFLRSWGGAHRKLQNYCPRLTKVIDPPAFRSLWVNHVGAGSEDSNCFSFGRNRTAVGS